MFHSVIRTAVPLIVAVILGQAAQVGLDLPEGAVTDLVTVLVGTAYYALARALEKRFPAAGSILLALGLTSRQPVYTRDLGTRARRM